MSEAQFANEEKVWGICSPLLQTSTVVNAKQGVETALCLCVLQVMTKWKHWWKSFEISQFWEKDPFIPSVGEKMLNLINS